MRWTRSAIYENVQLRGGMNGGGGGIFGTEILKDQWRGTLRTLQTKLPPPAAAVVVMPPQMPNLHHIIVDPILPHPMDLLDLEVLHPIRSARRNTVWMQVQ